MKKTEIMVLRLAIGRIVESHRNILPSILECAIEDKKWRCNELLEGLKKDLIESERMIKAVIDDNE